MNTQQFWDIIESARAKSPTNAERQAQLIRKTLESLAADEILAFDKIYNRLRTRAYSWDLWEAAKLLKGGCSDDGFEYFRAWLISRGRKTYEAALRSPDSLARLFDESRDDYECEALLYAAGRAYETVAGEPLRVGHSSRSSLTGTRCKSEKERRQRFPRLCKLAGDAGSAEQIVAAAKRSLAHAKTWASKMTALSLLGSLERIPASGLAVLEQAAQDDDERIRRTAKFMLRRQRLLR